MKEKHWKLLFDIYTESGSVSDFLEKLIELGATDFELLATKWREQKNQK